MYFERWVQRTLIHKSLGNETATASVLGEKEKKRKSLSLPIPLKIINRFREKTQKASGLFKCCINGRQVLYKSFLTLQKRQICLVTDNFINRLIEFQLKNVIRRK